MSFRVNINSVGLIVLFASVAFLLYSHSIDFSFFLILFLMGGVIFRAAERLWRHGTASVFIFAIFWAGYWCIVAYYAFMSLGWVAFASSVTGHGGVIFLLFLAIFLFFVCLALAHLAALFLIPKTKPKL